MLRLNKDEVACILELHAQGLSGTVIAKRVGRSPAAIYNVIHNHGLKFHYEHPETVSPEEVEIRKAQVQAGWDSRTKRRRGNGCGCVPYSLPVIHPLLANHKAMGEF